MTELTVVGLDRGECDRLVRRLRTLSRDAALEVHVDVTSDALDVQRVGTLGGCTLLAYGRVVARNPFPGDSELKKLLVACVAQSAASELAMTA